MKTTFFITTTLSFILSAHAGFKGDIHFSSEERAEHLQGIKAVTSQAKACMKNFLRQQTAFFKENGISKYYGDNSEFSKLTYSQKENYVNDLGLNPKLVAKMEATSCVGMAMACLKEGFYKAGQNQIWDKIRYYTTVLNDSDGVALQLALHELGWKILYWNPDVTQNKTWDADEKESNPTNKLYYWGYHDMRYQKVLKDKSYYGVPVDDSHTLVNFKNKSPEFIRRVPLFVGTAHAGYHVFPGFNDVVIEAHSTRRITDARTVETALFNPLEKNGGPSGAYRSGLIAIPPGELDSVDTKSQVETDPMKGPAPTPRRTPRPQQRQPSIFEEIFGRG